MELSEVKYNLGKPVRLQLSRHYVDKEYLLTGCILRKKPTGEFFYQAELSDIASKSIVIASLDDISVVKGSPTVGERKKFENE